MSKSKLLASALVATLGAAGVAQAAGKHAAGIGIESDALPADIQALVARHSERFVQADANGDGQLGIEEVEAAILRMRAERRLARLDENNDGTISEAEFVAPAERRLERVDANGDGQITKDELRANRDDRRKGHHHEGCGDRSGKH